MVLCWAVVLFFRPSVSVDKDIPFDKLWLVCRLVKALRQSAVEPVFGILTQFMGMRKVYTKGIQKANKQMLMAATAYNLKKLLKHSKPHPKSVAQSMKARKPLTSFKTALHSLIFGPYPQCKFCF